MLGVAAQVRSWRSVAQQDEAVALALAVCVMLGVAAWCSDVLERDEDVDADATEERHGAQEKPPGSAKNTSPVEAAGRAVEGPLSPGGNIVLVCAVLAIATACAALSFGGPAPAAKLVAQLESWRSVAQQDEAVALVVAVCVMLGVAASCSDLLERDEDEAATDGSGGVYVR